MKALPLIVFSLKAAMAHVISMSTGFVSVEAKRAYYELRMPSYEVADVKDPARSLLGHIRFTSGGREARLIDGTCRQDTSQAVYVCAAEYDFPSPVDGLDVDCTLYAATVPNHVHLLRAEKGGVRDQAVFDASFSKATLRFRSPTPVETALTETGAGMVRALGGFMQVLFLASLVLAARGRRELIIMAAMFLIGQTAVALIVPRTGWQPPARFIEAVAALTVAYLAVEVLLLPRAGQRWLIAGALGAFHGLYFAAFLQNGGYHAGYFLAGAAIAEGIVLVLFGVARRFSRIAPSVRPVQVSASVLLAIGMIWFFLRLRS